MIAKPKQRKRMDWYMVLAMFVLLISFSTSPRAMDSQTIVTGSSASRHALGVDPENINGDGEDRVLSTFPAKRMQEYLSNILDSVECKHLMAIKKRARWNNAITDEENRRLEEEYSAFEETFVRRLLELPTEQILAIIVSGKRKKWFQVTAKRLEASLLLCSDEKVLGILAAGMMFRQFKAAAERFKDSILLEPDEKVLGMIAAGKNVFELKAAAKSLEDGLLTRWFFKGQKDALFAYLREGQSSWIEFLKSPFWTALINDWRSDNKDVFKMVFEMLEPHISGEELGRLIIDAKRIDGTRELAKGLVRLWWEAGYSGYVHFKVFGLDQAKGEVMKSVLWNRWVSYLRWLAEKEDPGTPKDDAMLVALALYGHEADDDVKMLIATGKTDAETSQFANRLERIWLTLGN